MSICSAEWHAISYGIDFPQIFILYTEEGVEKKEYNGNYKLYPFLPVAQHVYRKNCQIKSARCRCSFTLSLIILDDQAECSGKLFS